MQYKSQLPTLVFCVAATADASLLLAWEKHLLPLQQAGFLTLWSDHHLLPGEDRDHQMQERLNQANLIVFLISPDFFASDECTQLASQTLKRSRQEQVRIVPLLLRPVAWQESPLSAYSCLPSDGRPVTIWNNIDDAFQNSVDGIRQLLRLPRATVSTHQQQRAIPLQQNRRRMLGRLRRSYSELLIQSLQEITWIELGLARIPAAVQNATNRLMHLSYQDPQLIPPDTSILEVYEASERELLILGEPGAGKSTLLLHLAQALVQGAEQDEMYPLPVILRLSSWAEQQPALEDWISEQLTLTYDVPQKLSAEWVKQEHILALLDGLDEMDTAARPACITAINAYHREHLVPLVICSRRIEYEEAARQQRLELQHAVLIQPLTLEQVHASLNQIGKPLDALQRTLKTDAALQELITTPLMLSIVMLTYWKTSLRVPSNKGSTLQKQVWTDYVEHMVEQKGDSGRYPLPQTCLWLGWLARHMREHNQTIFYMEHIKSDWLETRQRRTYTWLAIRLPSILIGALIAILSYLFLHNTSDPTLLLQFGMFGGFLGGCFSQDIGADASFPDSVNRSVNRVHSKKHRKIITRWAISVLIGLLYGLSFGLDFPYFGLGEWLLEICLSGVVIGLSCWGFISLLPSQQVHITSIKPMQPWSRLLHTLHGRRALLGTTLLGSGVLLDIMLRVILRDAVRSQLQFGLIDALDFNVTDALSNGLSLGPITLLVSLALHIYVKDIHFTERLRWTWRSLLQKLFAPRHLATSALIACSVLLLIGLNAGLSGLSYALSGENTELIGVSLGLGFGLGSGLSAGLSYWLLLGLFQGISQEQIEDEDRRVFNQGTRRSLRNGAVIGLISGVMIGAIGILSSILSDILSNLLFWWINDGLNYGLASLDTGLSNGLNVVWLFAISGGLMAWAMSGGWAVLRYSVLRALLSRSHIFPWRVQAFLDDAITRIFLLSVGGGYSFVHRLLLDYFAHLEGEDLLISTPVQKKA